MCGCGPVLICLFFICVFLDLEMFFVKDCPAFTPTVFGGKKEKQFDLLENKDIYMSQNLIDICKEEMTPQPPAD